MKKYILIASVALFAASCTEDVMDDINKDTNNPPVDAVPARLQITDAILSSAFSTSSGAYAWYLSSYTEQEFGSGNNQLQKVETRNNAETMASTTYNNEWNGAYSNLQNLKQIITKCETKENASYGASDLLGMAQLLTAHDFAVLTDLHGDIPCSEALQGQGNLQPNVDKQEDIYNNTILAMIDKAIINFQAAIDGKKTNVGSQDILFNNDNKKWLASAYAMKARYLLHTSYRNNTVYTAVIDAATKAITNGFEGMNLDIFDGNATTNPWAAYYNSREYTGVTTTVANILTARNDARINAYAFPYYYNGEKIEKISAPGDKPDASLSGGLSQPAWLYYQRTTKDPSTPVGGAASIQLLSKAELYFILAEAKARLGQDATAEFNTGVKASFDDFESFLDQFSEEYEAYVVNAKEEGKTPIAYSEFYPVQVEGYINSLQARYAAKPIAEIMVQKYISQCRDGQIEAYNDIRRCKAIGELFITMTNPNNVQSGANCWPERLPYGNSSVTANPNIKKLYGDGSYVFTEKVWLYGGNR